MPKVVQLIALYIYKSMLTSNYYLFFLFGIYFSGSIETYVIIKSLKFVDNVQYF